MVGEYIGVSKTLKNLFWKGAGAVGATNSLSRIVDDSRIS